MLLHPYAFASLYQEPPNFLRLSILESEARTGLTDGVVQSIKMHTARKSHLTIFLLIL